MDSSYSPFQTLIQLRPTDMQAYLQVMFMNAYSTQSCLCYIIHTESIHTWAFHTTTVPSSPADANLVREKGQEKQKITDDI